MNTLKTLGMALTICSLTNIYGQMSTNKPNIKGEEVTYTVDGITCKGYLAYDASQKGKRAGILVVPEWWGVTAYTRHRADMLAALGYVAMVVDMYGEGKVAVTPDEAQKLATPFYSDPNLGKSRIDAAEKKLKGYPATDAHDIAAIGYCFGGAMVLNDAKMGADFKATVSFHGGLNGVPAATGAVKGKILVCHGADDKFVSADEVKAFRRNLDSVGVNYTFIAYEGATHAFTNPDATATGKKFNIPIAYNEKADKASWEEMKKFLKGTL
jgi:dienelactone hydrolase